MGVAIPAAAEPQASRDRILDAAEELFARRGFAGVGMREVADAAGLGKSSVFHHFPTKAELYMEVAVRLLAGIEQRLTRSLAAGGPPLARLDRCLDCLIDVLAEDHFCARLFLRSLFEEDAELEARADADPRGDQLVERILGGIAGVLREGMDSGVLRPVNIAHTLQSLIGLTVFHFASGEFGDQLFGRSPFTPSEVKRRKQEVRNLLHAGLVAR